MTDRRRFVYILLVLLLLVMIGLFVPDATAGTVGDELFLSPPPDVRHESSSASIWFVQGRSLPHRGHQR